MEQELTMSEPSQHEKATPRLRAGLLVALLVIALLLRLYGIFIHIHKYFTDALQNLLLFILLQTSKIGS